MNTMKRFSAYMLYVAIVMMALIMTVGPAAAVIDITDGEVAEPGSELHALGSKALEEGLGGICYFTNGEGQVLKVQAEEMENGDLNVAVAESNIPRGLTAKTQDQTAEAERIFKDLETLASQQPWVGGYAVLPHSEGAKAYEFGVMVEQEMSQGEIPEE